MMELAFFVQMANTKMEIYVPTVILSVEHDNHIQPAYREWTVHKCLHPQENVSMHREPMGPLVETATVQTVTLHVQSEHSMQYAKSELKMQKLMRVEIAHELLHILRMYQAEL